ncbi:putative 3-oxoacyl-reductase [Clohesyomyces aquaticus]|uniref:Putative 3-oxoacyl-reductase n=1 Tax=Clohesyomyces aquaticus TaxID=1231657 RepID=A0A1Y1YGI6_9PLEO|nr:putative 3-oxoacyl-reductase [Clohesyomyces aquaticus]
MGGQFGFLVNQITFKPKPLPSDLQLDKQTALVTGSNVGIGLECARQLASHGISRIVLAVRTLTKGESAKSELAKSAPKCDIEVWQLDLESFETTGHETNVQVNHLGTALLSLLLLPALQSNAKKLGVSGRLTFASSEVHFWTPFKEQSAPNILARMDEESSFGPSMERYNTSKLLNVFWFRELAARVDAGEVIVNGANPGFCASELHRHDSSPLFQILNKLLAWTPEQGAYFFLDAAVTKKEASHGAYIQEQKITEPSALVLSPKGKEIQKRLWAETLELLKKACLGASLDEAIASLKAESTP